MIIVSLMASSLFVTGMDVGAGGAAAASKIFNPWNPKNRDMSPSDIIPILKRYGWKGRFRDFTIIAQAFCHKSYVDRPEMWAEAAAAAATSAKEVAAASAATTREAAAAAATSAKEVAASQGAAAQGAMPIIAERPEGCMPLRKADNEELEFEGDRVLGLVVASYLKKRYPGQGEGFLTRILSRIVNNKQLGKLAKQIGLGPWIILSRHMEEVCDGRNNLRILGSAFEALIGALLGQEEEIGRGVELCNTFIINIIEKHVDIVSLIVEDTNYKDQLLRFFQAKYHVPPRYTEVAVEGPPHDRIFTMGVLDPSDNIIATFAGRNKKTAEQEASRLALEALGV
jgi:ribonuclease-3